MNTLFSLGKILHSCIPDRSNKQHVLLKFSMAMLLGPEPYIPLAVT